MITNITVINVLCPATGASGAPVVPNTLATCLEYGCGRMMQFLHKRERLYYPLEQIWAISTMFVVVANISTVIKYADIFLIISNWVEHI